ncbi:MAG TPA: Slp family lipoprotein [Nitrospira sp.]|nr:Slp family lipoprotein [Nitrospira sp.]
MRYATANARWEKPMGGLTNVIACCALVSACSPSVFPYKALDGVNHDFDFLGWQLLQDQNPQQKVQLGGRIVQAEMKDDMVTITATHLSIPKDPTQEPEEAKPSGEFLIQYSAVIDPLVLRSGNKLIVVGETGSPGQIEVEKKVRLLPRITALCIHFWNTDGKGIALRGSSSSGTKFLAELTYCKTAL